MRVVRFVDSARLLEVWAAACACAGDESFWNGLDQWLAAAVLEMQHMAWSMVVGGSLKRLHNMVPVLRQIFTCNM